MNVHFEVDPFFLKPEAAAALPIHPAAELLPLLEGDARAALTDDIREHGLLEPIWLYDDPESGITFMLDGRNRTRACLDTGTPISTRHYLGDEPVAFVLSENAKRRDLTTGQRAALAETALPMLEAEAAKRKAHGETAPGRPKETLEADLPQALERAPQSRDVAAKRLGTSGRAVAQFKRVKQQAPDLAEEVRLGHMALDRAERVVRDREAESRRVAQAKAEAAMSVEPLTLDLRLGDFATVLSDVRDVHAIITDPPYERDAVPMLATLAKWADTVLAPDGILAVLFGQYFLPDAFQALSGYRPYRWTACYLTDGPGYASHDRKLQSNWKPVLIYGGGPRFSDVIRSTGDDKERHKWGQNYDAFRILIERLTLKGQTVVDPFMGSGTTLLAARALGRHAIGCEIDPTVFSETKKRLSEDDGASG